MKSLWNIVLDKVKDRVDAGCVDGNIGTSERILSVVSGGLIVGIGIRRVFRSPISAISSLSLGGALVYRGITGRCTVKSIVDKVAEKEEVTVVEHRYFVK